MNNFDIILANLFGNKQQQPSNNRLLAALANSQPNALNSDSIRIAPLGNPNDGGADTSQQSGANPLEFLKLITRQLSGQPRQNGQEQVNAFQQQQEQRIPIPQEKPILNDIQAMGGQQALTNSNAQPLANSPSQAGINLPAASKTISDNTAMLAANSQPQPIKQNNGSKIKSFLNSPFVDTLQDILVGLASGRTGSESLGLSGVNAINGVKAREQQNKTINWLVNNGFSQDQAKAILASDKDTGVLREIFKASTGFGAKQESPYSFIPTSTGQLIRTNKVTGQAEPILDIGQKPETQIVPTRNGDVYSVNKITNEATKLVSGDNSSATEEIPVARINEDGTVNKEDQEEILKLLPDKYKAIVPKIANGDVDPRVEKLSNSERRELTDLVVRYNPNYDQNYYPTKAALEKNYATGEMAKTRNSINLALQHTAAYKQSFDALHNSSHPLYNAALDKLSKVTQSDRSKELLALQANGAALGEEIVKALKPNGIANQSELEEWRKIFSSSATPEQTERALEKVIQLLAARADTYRTTYSATAKKEPPAFLTPETVKSLINVMNLTPQEIHEIDPSFDFGDKDLNNGR